MTRGQAAGELAFILVGHSETSRRGQAVLMAIEALSQMEAIQEVVDMPTLWEQDDRRRYAKIVDLVRKDSRIKIDIPSDDTSHPFADDVLMGGD